MRGSIIMHVRLWTQHSSTGRGVARFLLSVYNRPRKLAAPFFVGASPFVLSRRVLVRRQTRSGSAVLDSGTFAWAIPQAPLGQ
jgi:hypothetical protein